MLTELCQELRNWFDLDRIYGEFTISGGALTADFLKPNQYYRIIGSVFNDGVHQYGNNKDVLTDEAFNGAVWALAIPKEVVQLAEEIKAWRALYEATGSQAMSPYVSESFGGYSYSKGTGNNTGSTNASSWISVFKPRLNMWRKILP